MNKQKLKNLKSFAVGGAILILGLIAIFTTFKIYQMGKKPIAPTVPKPAPAAGEQPSEACTLTVIVNSPTPTPTPPAELCNITFDFMADGKPKIYLGHHADDTWPIVVCYKDAGYSILSGGIIKACWCGNQTWCNPSATGASCQNVYVTGSGCKEFLFTPAGRQPIGSFWISVGCRGDSQEYRNLANCTFIGGSFLCNLYLSPTPTPSVRLTLSPTISPSPATPTPETCLNDERGNLNCDSRGLIDEADLNILLSNWSPDGPVPSPEPGLHSADLNNDDRVDGTDLTILLSNWKTGP